MQSAERFLANAQRRQHRGVHLAIAIGVGVAAAAAMSLLAGARRSDTVVERVFNAVPKADVRLYDRSGGLQTDFLRSLPGVERATPTDYMAFTARDAPNQVSASINSNPADFNLPNPSVRILRGHRPDPNNPLEVIVNLALVSNLSLDVGDTLPVIAFGADQYDDIASGIYEPHGPEYDFTIAAIVRFPEEIALDEPRSPRLGFTSAQNMMIVSETWFLQHGDEMIDFGASFDVRLADGSAGIDAFIASVRDSMADPNDLIFEPWTVADNQAAFSVPVELETSALLAVGLGAALIAFVLGVLLVRVERRLLEDDYPIVRSMGFTARHLTSTAMARVLPAALAATAIATVGAISLSGRFPIGVGRELEFERGVHVDLAVVMSGALCVLAGLVGGAALAARRAGLRSARAASPRPRNLLGTGRLPLHASIGARFAAGGRDSQRQSPAAATLVTAIAATAIVLAVSIWLVGTAQLYNSPSSRGWQWDLAIGNVNFSLDDATLESVTQSPLVSAATAIGYGGATLNGVSAEVLAYDPAGTAPPATLRGRLPITASEIALGAGLIRKLNVAIGDSVVMSLASSEFVVPPAVAGDVTLTVVGESVSPSFGESDIADVGVVTLSAISAANGNSAPNIVLVDVVGPDVAANIDSLIAPLSEEVHSDSIPARIVNLRRVRTLPNVGRWLAGFLGLIAIGATLLAPARANRQRLAVLSALGLDGGGRRWVAVWQGAFTAAVVLLVGVPIGLLLGTAWWRSVVDDLGVRNLSPLAPAAIAVTTASALLGAIAAALLAVRRVSVAGTLRGE